MAETIAHQMLLSNDNILITHSPNVNDIIWENVAIPKNQVTMSESTYVVLHLIMYITFFDQINPSTVLRVIVTEYVIYRITYYQYWSRDKLCFLVIACDGS